MSTIQDNTSTNHKYSTGYQYLTIETPETHTVRFSTHAAEQWDIRTPEWSMSPESALRQSEALSDLSMSAFRSPYSGTTPDMVYYTAEWTDEAVTDEYYEALFMEQGETVTTVYIRDFIDNDPIHGYLDVLKEKFNNGI